MKTVMRNGALALALMSGAALTAPPALANDVHNEGYFGGSWTKIEPSSDYYERRRHAGRVGPLYSGRYYYGPRYSTYAPRRAYYGYYGAPYYYGPGVSLGFGFY